MIKVLHLFKTSLPSTFGGVEKVIDQICAGTKDYEISSTVLALTRLKDFQEIIEYNGYELQRLKSDINLASTDISLFLFKRFAELAGEADIIHYHFPWPYMDIVHFTARINKPTLVTYHSDIVRQKKLLLIYKPLMHAFLSSVSKIVATSPNYLASSDVLRKYKEKVSIIPIGLEERNYSNGSENKIQYWRALVGERFYLFIGVLRYYKGLDVLLNANANVNLPLVIVGDGPLRCELESRAHHYGLTNTRFLGTISDEDKNALLSLCHGVVFPSHLRSEAFGVSLLEAAMYAKPMISCEIGTGTSFVNKHRVTGLVVSPNNSKELSDAMVELWNNSELNSIMGKNARLRFKKYFTIEKMGQAYAELYKELLMNK